MGSPAGKSLNENLKRLLANYPNVEDNLKPAARRIITLVKEEIRLKN